MSIATELTRVQAGRDTIRAKLVELGLASDTDKIDALAEAAAGIVNRGAVSLEVGGGETITIPAGYHNGSGTVSGIGGGSGGGMELNFEIVGNPQPSSPAVNTIWIDTDEAITCWDFNTVEPESPTPGMVWIWTGTTSSAKFNALPENGITVNPWAARQYIGGVWVGKPAQIWKDGSWVDWAPYLYHRGDECTDITNGWDCKSWKMQSDAGTTAQTFTITRNADHLMFTKTGAIGAVMYAVNPIDLTNVKTIHFKGEMSLASRNSWVSFNVWSKMGGSYWATNRVATVNTTTSAPVKTFSLDVSSLSGKYYVGFGIYNENHYVKLEELYLEVNG